MTTLRERLYGRVRELLRAGTLHWSASEYVRYTVIGTILAGILGGAVLWVSRGPVFGVLGALFGVFLGIAFFAFLLTYSPYRKSHAIEEELPEVLDLLASNLQAGLTLEQGLEQLVTPQYEPLSTELRIALAEDSIGVPLEDALMASTERVDSGLYERVMSTLVKAMKAGTNIEEVVDALAEQIEETQRMRSQIQSAAMGYKAFLTFSALIGAPFLFALSAFLVRTLTELTLQQTAAVSGSDAVPAGFLSIGTALPPLDLLTNFFLAMIALTAMSTSVGIGIVSKGSALEGIKLSPVFIGVAFAVYWIGGQLMSMLIGGIV